jgi:tetratricopeptide (TPR) repeat protein
MSSISEFFRRKPEQPAARVPVNWEQRLETLEAEAEGAPPAFQGTPLNRAGDLCLRVGAHERALDYYGRAIDALLGDGQREAARGVANKIIRVHPEAVRTLCTLTWLDLAAGHQATALMHLRDYVSAAIRVEQEALAADQIYGMAGTATDAEFLVAAAESLDRLGFPDRAARVREWSSSAGGPEAIRDPHRLASACLEAAVGSNERRG